MIKNFKEFVNEGLCCKSWSEDELTKYISKQNHEPQPGMWTDDDGSFKLSYDPEFTEDDLDFERFCTDYDLDKGDFVGIYAYYNNITGQPENEDELVLIWYDRETHKFEEQTVDWENDIKKYLKKR